MNYSLLIPLLITTIVTIIGWFAAHQFTVAQGRANKRRDLRVQYLIDAYRNLEIASNRVQLTGLENRALESAIADIQLFGTKSQVREAQCFVEDFARNGGASVDKLLTELRNDLRCELKLGAVSEQTKYLRIMNHEDVSQAI